MLGAAAVQRYSSYPSVRFLLHPQGLLGYTEAIMILLLILALVVLFILWNATLFGYKDRNTEAIEPDLDNLFGPMASPIILTKEGNTKAILMPHGFPSTPSIYLYSSERFFAEGIDVHAPLLPGFGSDPEYFGRTTFTQWFDYLSRYYERLRAEYETVYVLGISMGGLMTLKLAEIYADTPQAPDAAVSIAAPVVYNSIKDGIITDWRGYFALRTLSLFTPSVGAKVVQGITSSEDGGNDWYGYGGLYLRPGISLINAMKTVRKDLGKITCPLLVIHDRGDKTVPFKNVKVIEAEHNSRSFTILETEMPPYNHTRHALLMYPSVQKELTDTIIAFLKEHDEDEKA